MRKEGSCLVVFGFLRVVGVGDFGGCGGLRGFDIGGFGGSFGWHFDNGGL